MNDEKEKDEVEEIFNRALEIQDQKKIDEEEEKEDEIPNTHNLEYIAPIASIILAVASFFDLFWFAAYFGLIFSGVGIFMCKKKREYIQPWVILLNVIALAMCVLVGGLWIIMYISKNM
jgi:predicted histidine transporter YuiF (NhaC family)